MKRHRNFEFYAGEYLRQQGFTVTVCQGVNDWGVDLFAEKDGEKYVVQAKMYGTSKTKVNRRQLFELFGVMHYFDCQKSILVYNGRIMDDAIQVAHKLGIQFLYLDYTQMEVPLEDDQFTDNEYDFYQIWEQYIVPFQHQTLHDTRGLSYQIGNVTDGYIERISSNGKSYKVKADLFKWVVNRIHSHGIAESIDLRNLFSSIHSSFVTLIFANIPLCKVEYNPRRISFREKE